MPPDIARESVMCTATTVLPQPASGLPDCSSNATSSHRLSNPEDPASQPAAVLQCAAAHATAIRRQALTEEQQQWALVLQHFAKTCRLVCHPMAHFKQLFSWDCGLACAVMAIRAVGAHHQHCDYGILRQLCPTTSIWTVDLAHLLRQFGLDVFFFTVTLGPNPAFYNESFYLAHMQDDERRVSELFRGAHAAGIRLQQRSVCWQELAAYLVQGDALVLLLIDKRKLDPWLLAADLCLPYALCGMDIGYAGHYILLVGWDAAAGQFLVRDPSMDGHVEMRVSPGVLDAARRAFGTDEDILVVQHPGLRQTVVLLPSEQQPATASTATSSESGSPRIAAGIDSGCTEVSDSQPDELTAGEAMPASAAAAAGSTAAQGPIAHDRIVDEPEGNAMDASDSTVTDTQTGVPSAADGVAAGLQPHPDPLQQTSTQQVPCIQLQQSDVGSHDQQQGHMLPAVLLQQQQQGQQHDAVGQQGACMSPQEGSVACPRAGSLTVNMQPSWTWYWWMMGGYGSSHGTHLQRMSLQQQHELLAAQQQQLKQQQQQQGPVQEGQHQSSQQQGGSVHTALCMPESEPKPQETALQISCQDCPLPAQPAVTLAAAVPWVPTQSEASKKTLHAQPVGQKSTAFEWVGWGRQQHGHQRPVSSQDNSSGCDMPSEGSKAKKARQRDVPHGQCVSQHQPLFQQQHATATPQQQHAGSPGSSWSFWSWSPSAATWAVAWTGGAATSSSTGNTTSSNTTNSHTVSSNVISSNTAGGNTSNGHSSSGSSCNSSAGNGSGMVSLAAFFYGGSSASHSKAGKAQVVVSRCHDAAPHADAGSMARDASVMQSEMAQAQQQQKLLLA